MIRNREFRQFAILFSFLSVLNILVGFLMNTAAGILAMTSAIVFGTVFFLFTRKRYRKIAQMSNQIDLVLHNENRLYIDELEEGELSILQSEITKMTLRIREQNDTLKKEKERLSDSLADIAHQLRTPLTSANLILTLLADSSDEKQRKAFLREMEALLLHMDWLLTSLLKLSRLDAGIVVFQRESVDIHDLVHTAVRPFLIPMELHNMELQIKVPKGLVIQGDFSWLSEAVRNIVKNCMESAGDYGKITIVWKENPLATEIVIQDSGTGFQKEELPYLFDRFYCGKNTNTTGYGIGLALCKMIIIQQGGKISAKNHPQGGAMFSICFPK